MPVTAESHNLLAALRAVSSDLRRRELLPVRLERCCTSLGAALGVDRVAVRRVDDSGSLSLVAEWLSPRISGDEHTQPPAYSVGFSRLIADSLDTQVALACDDVAFDQRLAPTDTSVMLRRGVHALVTYSFGAHGGSSHWLLLVEDHTGPHRWSPAEIGTIEGFGRDIECAVARDRSAELDRDLSERLHVLEATRNAFVSSVSHELRSPLASMLGYLELLRDHEYGPLEPAQDHALEVIDRSCRRLNRLIEDLLITSSEEEGRQRIQLDPVDLSRLVWVVTEAVAPSMRERDLELAINVTDDPCFVRGDADQLERVLLNLLQNAVKFTEAGGTVSVSVAAHEATTTISVSDTGRGIPASEQPYVFDRFFRGLEADVEGTGLGLFIVKTMLELHGGSVSLASQAGRGTTVTCTLPVVHLATINAPSTGSPPGQRLRHATTPNRG